MRQHYFLLALVVLILFYVGGCAPSPKPPSEPQLFVLADLPVPHNLVAVAGDNQVDLNWKLEGKRDEYVLGCNVYAETRSLEGISVDKLPASRGTWPPIYVDSDTINSWTNYILDNLENGKKYFIHIRLKGSNQRISPASNEVAMIPHPEGVIKLYETRSKHYSAFEFSKQKKVSSKNKHADIIFDEQENVAMLLSPHLRKKGLRQTGIVDMRDLRPFNEITNVENIVFGEEILAVIDHVVVIKTEDSHYAKLLIEKIEGKIPNRYIEFRYCYQMLPDLPEF